MTGLRIPGGFDMEGWKGSQYCRERSAAMSGRCASDRTETGLDRDRVISGGRGEPEDGYDSSKAYGQLW